MCQMCHECPESIAHVIAGCSALAQTKYVARHNGALKILFFFSFLGCTQSPSQPPFGMSRKRSPERDKGVFHLNLDMWWPFPSQEAFSRYQFVFIVATKKTTCGVFIRTDDAVTYEYTLVYTTVTAFKLNTLWQHRTNASLEKHNFSNEGVPLTRMLKTFINIRITPQSFYGIKT